MTFSDSLAARLHGTTHTIKMIRELDSLNIARADVLDPELKSQVAAKIAAKEEILFLGNDIAETRQKEAYQLIIHGILPCGSKTTIMINGVNPHIDVRLLDSETERAAIDRINKLALLGATEDFEIDITNIDFKTGNDFLYYDDQKHTYARIHFKTIRERKEFIAICRARGIKTYSNDKSTYYRVVARGYEINLSGWNVLRKYEIAHGSMSKAAYSFYVDINDIGTISDDKQLAEIAIQQQFDPALVKYENMIISSFDIEMIPARADRFPDADKNPNDSIFMICMTYHFVKRSESLLSVCLTLKETDPLDNVLMIYCKTEKCLLEAFAKFMAFMQPDFITEFNGGGFDWRNIITKANITNALPTFLENMSIMRLLRWETSGSMLGRYHRECRIKINGATADSICKGLKMQGFVSFDTLVVFKQLEPNADSHKLNECLRRCNLGSKDDMDVQEMFRIYREGTSTEMRLVAHYCYIDTFKLQQLLLKKNVVQDRREVANLSYTSLHDNFYFAGGSRMRNLLMNRGSKLGYFFDTEYRPEIKDEDAKFPGAYVVPPIKGIVKPMMRLDEFMQLNETISHSEAMLRDGYAFIDEHFDEIYCSDNKMNPDDAPEMLRPYIEYATASSNQYPVSGLDYASLYPSIIMTYNISPEKLIIDRSYAESLMAKNINLQYVSFPFCGELMEAWFVRHNNVVDDYSICGKLLIELFDRRAALKKVLKHYGEQIFEMEQEMKPYIERDALEEYPRIAEYNETKFDHISCDSKQKAVKIFMNTLYGEMGNFISCICAVQVAGSVTAMGRHNLKLAKAFVESELKMKTYYGDSVVGDTPIMIKRNGVKELLPIEDLDDRYVAYNGGKECIDYSNENVSVMTEDGYSKIMKVIRHRTNKKLYRVTTHIGSVIVTEDHSLLDSNKKKIKPNDCVVGTELLHWDVMTSRNVSTVYSFIMEDQLSAQMLYLQLINRGFFVTVNVCGDSTYQLIIENQSKYKSPTAIKSIEEIGECDGYVYDLETESHHFAAGVGRMVVHNTDSLYVSCNAEHFAKHDREYFTGRIDKMTYGTRLVETTFEQIEIAKNAVNTHLINDNGSKFLKMAYEEVLYPVAFLSKKKYYGVPHEENVDFYPRKLFLRGLEIVKRGASDVLKNVINEVLLEAMDLKNTEDIIEIVKKAISRVFNTNWPVDAFAKTKVYRPDKKNVSVLTMMKRYQAMNYHTIPEPNVRFKYVICKYYPWTYDIEGRQTKHTIGDCMELVERVYEEGLEIDLEYYFDNELTGQFARLITFCDQFSDATSAIEPIDISQCSELEIDIVSKEYYNRTEDALFKAAKKFIGQLAKHYSKAYVNKGSLFANTWRETGKFIKNHPEIFAQHLKIPQAIVINIFARSTGAEQYLLTWATRHIATRYRVTFDEALSQKLARALSSTVEYIQDNDLEQILSNCQTQWQQRAVMHIREEYAYDQICKKNLAYDTLWDVLSEDELTTILSDPELFPAISVDNAMEIIDKIAWAIARTLTATQLTNGLSTL